MTEDKEAVVGELEGLNRAKSPVPTVGSAVPVKEKTAVNVGEEGPNSLLELHFSATDVLPLNVDEMYMVNTLKASLETVE